MTTVWPPNNPGDEPHAAIRSATDTTPCGALCTCGQPKTPCPEFGHLRPTFDSVDWEYSAPICDQIATRVTTTTTVAPDDEWLMAAGS